MKKLIERQHILENTKAVSRFNQLGELLNILEKRELPNEIIDFINQHIALINSISDTDKNLAKTIKEKEKEILTHIEQKTNIVPKNHYRKRWLSIGIGAFGLPIGVTIGSVSGNMGMLGAGLPIGLGVGSVVGSSMDKKAFKEGRQLDFEVKH